MSRSADIAAGAGVGVGTLYRSYPDREVLLYALEHAPTAAEPDPR